MTLIIKIMITKAKITVKNTDKPRLSLSNILPFLAIYLKKLSIFFIGKLST